MHCLIVRNLPVELDPERVEKDLTKILESAFGLYREVVGVRVVGRHGKLLRLSKKWFKVEKQLRMEAVPALCEFEEQNQAAVRDRGCCCCRNLFKGRKFDRQLTHDILSNKLELLKEQMIQEEKDSLCRNNGCFFLVFRHV